MKRLSCGCAEDMRRKNFGKFESKQKNPVFFTCTVVDSDGKICGVIGKCDMGIEAKIRYPCPKHWKEMQLKGTKK